MSLIRFAHLMGFALWFGGAITAMVQAIGARDETPAVRAGVYRLLARVQTMVVGVGAILVVVTGLLLTMRGAGELMREPRIWVMQATGLLGGLMVLLIGLPTAIKLGGLAVANDKGELPPAFDLYRRRQAIVSSIAGVFALLALAAWKLL